MLNKVIYVFTETLSKLFIFTFIFIYIFTLQPLQINSKLMLLPRDHSGSSQGGEQTVYCLLMLPVMERGMTVSNSLCCFTLWMRRSQWTRRGWRAMDWVSLTRRHPFPLWWVSRSVNFAWHTVIQKKTFVNHNGHSGFQQRHNPRLLQNLHVTNRFCIQNWLHHVVPCRLTPWRCNGTCKKRTLHFEARDRMMFGNSVLCSHYLCVWVVLQLLWHVSLDCILRHPDAHRSRNGVEKIGPACNNLTHSWTDGYWIYVPDPSGLEQPRDGPFKRKSLSMGCRDWPC